MSPRSAVRHALSRLNSSALPAPVNSSRRRVMVRSSKVSAQRQGRQAAAPLLGAQAVPFVGQEPLQRHEEERAEPALLPRGGLEVILLQQAGGELFGPGPALLIG